MATIIEQYKAPDGWDVRCELSNGYKITFHFPEQPADPQATVDALETEYSNEVEWLPEPV